MTELVLMLLFASLAVGSTIQQRRRRRILVEDWAAKVDRALLESRRSIDARRSVEQAVREPASGGGAS